MTQSTESGTRVKPEPRIAVIGGGINGAGAAWELARKGYDVTLFDKGAFGAQTSAATTKLIHGGLRYLEHFHVRLVRESLRERRWLLEHAPELVRPLQILLPVYDDSPRTRFEIRVGLTMYDMLAGRHNIARHRSLTVAEIERLAPVRHAGLRGGFSFWDAQVDDQALVRSVVAAGQREGVKTRPHTRVVVLERQRRSWRIRTDRGEELAFDLVVNAAGPWMNELLEVNDLPARYRLTLVRGSHLVLRRRVSEVGLLLQSVDDRRIFFVLPWKERTLVGTTEVVQESPPDSTKPSESEIEYLVQRFNRYFPDALDRSGIESTFAGARPLVGRAANPSAIGRDSRIVRHGSLVNVFGGKMTTFMALSRRVGLRVDNYFGRTRIARAPHFATDADSMSSEKGEAAASSARR